VRRETGVLRRSIAVSFREDGTPRVAEDVQYASEPERCCEHALSVHGYAVGCFLCDCRATYAEPDYRAAAGLPAACRQCGYSHGEYPCVVVIGTTGGGSQILRSVGLPRMYAGGPFMPPLFYQHDCGKMHSVLEDRRCDSDLRFPENEERR